MTDQELWAGFLQGDRTSFQQIYDRYYQHLFSYGMRRVNNADVVRDTIQDLFLYLWTKRKTISPTNNIKYYLLAAMRNQLIQVSVQGSKWQLLEPETTERFVLNINPESSLILKEELSVKAKVIIQALDQLTPKQKEVLYLRFFEDLSHEEIAELLDLSIKGVYKLKYRAMEALKDILNISKADLLIFLLLCRHQFPPF